MHTTSPEAKIVSKFECMVWESRSCFEAMENGDFVSHWQKLIDLVPYASVFQSPGFVIPWYLKNEEDHSPLILTAWDKGQLVGILPLARKIHKEPNQLCKNLFGAGGFYALYQTWAVIDSYLEKFWEQGVLGLLERFPGCSINLKSIPSSVAFDSLKNRKDFFSVTSVEVYQNPVLAFDHESYEKIIGKRHFKSKYNRISKAGVLEFKRIVAYDELDREFDEIAVFYNLRQGAAFNKMPFPAEKNDKSLFLAWLESGVLHATGMWLNGELVGAVIMLDECGKTAHLAGLITFSPSHAKYSPGLVHLYLLIMMMKKEGYGFLKLSPGYDSYKERFSNSHEALYELLISKNRLLNMRRRLRVQVRKFMLRKGLRPMEASVWIDKKKAYLKNKANKVFSRPTGLDELIHMFGDSMADLNEKGESGNYQIRHGDLSQLLLLNDYTFGLSRNEFLQDALKRLEENQKFLTISKEDSLLVCIWFKPDTDLSITPMRIFDPQHLESAYISKNLKINP